MTATDSDLNPEALDSRDLAIPTEIVASLPDLVRYELATMAKREQEAFIESFRARSASLVMAYVTSLIYGHYILLGRWAMSGWMWLSLFVASTLGVIWWLIDLVRMPRMVREHNHRVALDLLRQHHIAATGPSPLASS